MPFPWIPVAVGACVVVAIGKTRRHKDYGVMTEERKRIYQAALSGSLRNAADLRTLAAAFHGQGLFPQALMLEKRAALKERTPEVKAAHDTAFRRALQSTNREAIIEIAHAFASLGATGAAAKLMLRAAGLPSSEEMQQETQEETEQETAEHVPPASSQSDSSEEFEFEQDEDEPPPIRISGTITEETTAPRPAEPAARQPAALAESTISPAVQVIVTEGHEAA